MSLSASNNASQLPIVQISLVSYKVFSNRLKNTVPDICNLDSFKDQSVCLLISDLCKTIFNEEITSIITLLNNHDIGIAALDLPESPDFNKELNILYGAAIVIGIFNSIGQASIDPVNKIPFTLHTASHSSGKLLNDTSHTPDAKLGFHNDGIVDAGSLAIPHHIAVYNLYISYRNPGKFRWVPTNLWKENQIFGTEISTDQIRVKIKLTPYYHKDSDGNLVETELDSLEVPISALNKNKKRRYFLNGTLIDNANTPENIDLIKKIRNSIEYNEDQIQIDQKERRAFYIKNSMGFHARDVFNDPIEGVDLTRVFLRLVDTNADLYPSSKII